MQRLIIYILFLSILTACGEDRSSIEPIPDALSAIPRIASVSLPGEGATRSIITGTENFPEGGIVTPGKLSSIGLYAVYSDLSEYKPAHGSNTVIYQKTASGWCNPSLVDATNLFLPSDKSVNIYAWHPSGLSPDYEGGKLHVSNIKILAEDDFNATKQTDYLYAYGYTGASETVAAAVNSTNNPPLKFKMQHALAKLTFTVKKKTDNAETLKLKEFIMKTSDSQGFRIGEGASRHMSLINGEFVNLLPTSTLTYKGTIPLEVTTSGATVIALVAPVKALQLLSFEMAMNVGAGTDTRTYRTATLTNAATWGKGKEYKYTLVIDKMEARVEGDAIVYDWVTEESDIPIQ